MPERLTSTISNGVRRKSNSTGSISNTQVGRFFNQQISNNSVPLRNKSLLSRMVLINREINQFLKENVGEPKIAYDAAYHLIRAGGKRLRSLITMLCCEAVGGSVQEILPITVAAELLQTASLIHDDIIDNDEMRRGVETVHKKFGKDIAILAGDLLIAQAIRIIGKHGKPELLMRMGKGGIRMCEGEVADLLISPELEETFTEEKYLHMIERKTVAFMEEAAIIGAIVGKAKKKQQKALIEYARMLGFAFQLRDDIIDISFSMDVARKSTLSDLRLKRGNLPLIHALEVCTPQERHHCLQALARGDVQFAIHLIEASDALQYTKDLAQEYVSLAKRALHGNGFQKQKLLEHITDFVIIREH